MALTGVGALGTDKRRSGMGHKSNDTFGYYKTGIQDINTQAIVRGRAQRSDIIEESMSILDNRDLAAPQPPGARLIDMASYALNSDAEDDRSDLDGASDSSSDSSIDSSVENEEKEDETQPRMLSVAKLTPAQQYNARPQFRKKAYQKQRKELFKDRDDYFVAPDNQDSANLVPESTSQLRLPPRYLKSLLKHQPSRQKVIDLLHPDGVPHVKNALCLSKTLEPLIELASPEKRRYMYSSVQIKDDSNCGVCKKSFDA
jgi:hypothetical protein